MLQEQEPEPSFDMEPESQPEIVDMEDFGGPSGGKKKPSKVAVATKRKRDDAGSRAARVESSAALTESWEDVLGPAPGMGRKRVRFSQTLIE